MAALNAKDSDHVTGKELLSLAFEKSDWLFTSDYILDECISVAWSKTRKLPLEFRLSLIKSLDDTIQNSAKLKLEKVNETDFATAKLYLAKHTRTIPKLTDWTSLIVMRRNSINMILSLDADFRGFISLPNSDLFSKDDSMCLNEVLLCPRRRDSSLRFRYCALCFS